MKKIISCLAIVIVTAIISFIAFDFLEEGEQPDSNTRHITLYSDILKEDREAIIRLPRLYDSTRRYPVLYVLDAQSVDKPMADKVRILVDAGVIPEAIVVGIPNMTAENRELNLTPPFMLQNHEDASSSRGEGDRFLDFLEHELIPLVERKYGSSSRTFCGNSKGGLIVMYSLIHKPNLFNARICFSTPFWRQNDLLIDSVSNFLVKKDLPESFIYLSAGSDETENIRGGLERMTNMLRKNSGLAVYSTLTPKAVHADNAQISASEALVKWSAFIKASSDQNP